MSQGRIFANAQQGTGGVSTLLHSQHFFHMIIAPERLSRNNVVSVKQGTSARGYGGRHQALRKKLAALVASGRAVCWRCGRPILPGMAWDLGHDDLDRSIYRGVECRRCNRSSAATRGNKMRGKRRRQPNLRIFDDSRNWRLVIG